jgi:carbonic anhydrase
VRYRGFKGKIMTGDFSDIADSNAEFVSAFTGQNVPGLPAKKMLLLTCMDCRIIPHQVLSMSIGDMKVIRNGGGQLNSAVESDIVVANNVLDCDRILIMQHTQCGMAAATLESVRDTVQANTGVDASEFTPSVIENQMAKLTLDVETLRNNPMLKSNAVVQGAMYHVETGKVDFIGE